ncbi:MAG: hypothetical protein ABI574_01585 [Burkholderiales bacterium]
MATIDKLIQDILAPVETAVRNAPKVLGWFESTAAPRDEGAWAWLEASEQTSAGLEVTEHAMPMHVLAAVFGLAPAPLRAL